MNKLTYRTAGMREIWSAETVANLVQLINQKFQAFLNDEFFDLEANWCAEQIQLRTTLSCKDGSVVYPIECVYAVGDTRAEPEEVVNVMLDYMDIYWNEYLSEGRETFVTLDWSKHTCEATEFFVRGFVRNVALERAADALFEEEGTGDHVIEPISSES